MWSGIGWFARNRVAANLLMTAFVLSGLLAVSGILHDLQQAAGRIFGRAQPDA